MPGFLFSYFQGRVNIIPKGKFLIARCGKTTIKLKMRFNTPQNF